MTIESLSLYAVSFPNSNLVTKYISSLTNLKELLIKTTQQLNNNSFEKIFQKSGSNLNNLKIVGDSSDILCKLISIHCSNIKKLELNFQEITDDFQKISNNIHFKRNLKILHLKSNQVRFSIILPSFFFF